MLTNSSRLAIGLLLPLAAFAQPSDFAKNPRETTPSRHGVAALWFDLDSDPIGRGNAELLLRLPGGGVAILKQKTFDKRGEREGLWRGVANNRADSEVLLTQKGGYLAGTVRVGTDLYEIRPSAGGHILEKLNLNTFPACGGAAAARVTRAAGDVQPAGSATAPTATAAGDGVTVDLMSVYTPQARAAAGGGAQIQTVIQAAVDSANQAFVNSQVTAAYRLVHSVEAAHNDTGDMNLDLSWVASDATVAALRNQYGADMVSLIVENGASYCGLGYVQRSVGPGFAGSAFQVTARSCAVGNLSFAHEHGHNLGMEHDPANGVTPTSASFPWSFGYTVNSVFRTVMAYASPCPNGCTRVAYYSNPNVTYAGYPTGVINTQDNARTANSTMSVAAAFRTAAATAPPAAPSGLTAAGMSGSQINLSWTDAAADETGFRVERSQDGGATFSLVATLGANTGSFADAGLASATAYMYRVRAYNGIGDSANSNTAGATTTQLLPPSPPLSLSAVAVSSSQINLAWADGSTNENGFKIERSTLGGAFAQIATVGANLTSYASTGLTGGAAYSYRVRAYNADGNSAYTDVASATTPAGAPPTPAGLAGTPSYTGSGKNRTLSGITLSWSDVSGETGYRLERCKVSGKGSSLTCTYGLAATPGQNAGGYQDTGVLQTGKGTYKYRLRAESSVGSSLWVETSVTAN